MDDGVSGYEYMLLVVGHDRGRAIAVTGDRETMLDMFDTHRLESIMRV